MPFVIILLVFFFGSVAQGATIRSQWQTACEKLLTVFNLPEQTNERYRQHFRQDGSSGLCGPACAVNAILGLKYMQGTMRLPRAERIMNLIADADTSSTIKNGIVPEELARRIEYALNKLGYPRSETSVYTSRNAGDLAGIARRDAPGFISLLAVTEWSREHSLLRGRHFVLATGHDAHRKLISYIDPNHPDKVQGLTYEFDSKHGTHFISAPGLSYVSRTGGPLLIDKVMTVKVTP